MSTLVTPYEPPSVQFRRRLIVVGALVLFVLGTSVLLQFRPWQLITDLPHLLRLADDMLPPNLSLLWSKGSLYTTVGETLAMAFLGTLVGGGLALLLSFAAARNTMPLAWVRNGVRFLFGVERATPNFIVLQVLLIAIGFGPFAGMLSLCLGTVGFFGKLFADAIEQAEVGPAEAVQSVGATRLQVIRYAIVPQVLPSLVAQFFYAFDVNLRAAIVLGIYGGGGLGFELNLAIKVLRYSDVLALVLLIVGLISLTERLSDRCRRSLLGTDRLAKAL